MNNNSLILSVDSYKASHFKFCNPGTEFVNSYIEARGGRWDSTLFFGLQMFLKEYLSTPITIEDINEAEEVFSAHGEPFNKEGWLYILDKYCGYLPLRIQAVPEGLVIPTGNVLVQVINTDPKCYWLPSYIETALLRSIWYPTSVATNSYRCKNVIMDNLKRTADNPEAEINFKLHDFGARSSKCFEAAGIGGCAHLVNFMGTDTVTGLLFARKYYGENMAGYSVPATEHTISLSYGKDEAGYLNNVIDSISKEFGIFSIVGDTYDIYNFVSNVLTDEMVERVRNNKSKIVIRPDSGNPVEVTLKVIQILMDRFGYEVNTKGFKVLPAYLGVIQGDGVEEYSIREVLAVLEAEGISGSNMVFGMGSKLLDQLNRDDLSFAMKTSSICINGEWKNVSKSPITDLKKRSKEGILGLYDTPDGYQTRIQDPKDGNNLLELIWQNGQLFKDYTFKEIRELSSSF